MISFDHHNNPIRDILLFVPLYKRAEKLSDFPYIVELVSGGAKMLIFLHAVRVHTPVLIQRNQWAGIKHSQRRLISNNNSQYLSTYYVLGALHMFFHLTTCQGIYLSSFYR